MGVHVAIDLHPIRLRGGVGRAVERQVDRLRIRVEALDTLGSADLERGGERKKIKTAADVHVAIAREVDGIGVGHVRRGRAVVREIAPVEELVGGVEHLDAAGVVARYVEEVDPDRTTVGGDGLVEKTAVPVAALEMRFGTAETGLEPPAAVVVAEREVGVVALLIRQLRGAVVGDRGAAEGTEEKRGIPRGVGRGVGGRRRAVGTGVERELERADARGGAVEDVAKGEHAVAHHAPVGLRAEGIAGDVARAVDQQKRLEVGIRLRGGGEGAARARRSPSRAREVLLVVDFRGGAGDHDAEVARDGPREIKIRAGKNRVLELIALRVRHATERESLVVADDIDAPAELPSAALEGALADKIHGAAERVCGVRGRGDFGELDARNVVERHRAHIDGASGAGPNVGRGRAVGGDGGHRAAEAAHGDARDVGVVKIGGEARHEF